ncbi:MAG: hypothetical protein WC655_18570 [Candidatus Hydrogenedentales bacterium]|jgi:hypothetical protein
MSLIEETEAPRRASAADFVWPIALAAIVYLVTAIPYWQAERHAPEGARFIGQVAQGERINAYFSFIRQAAKGHYLFVNSMTYLDQEPGYFNVEFLVLGRLMRWFGWNTRIAFEVWRFLGALFLLSGFAFLAHVALRDTVQRRIAVLMCAFGGGLGTYAASIHPFGQMLEDPHVALTHGLWIALMACMVLGERDGRTQWYVAAACLVLVQGLCGPQNLIALAVVAVLFIGFESLVTKRFDWRRNMLRVLPALVSALLIAYYMRLSAFGPVAFFLSALGRGIPGLHWYLLSLGLAGVLFAMRIALIRLLPPASSVERLLFAWAVVPSCLTEFAQNAPSVAPMIVLGVALLRFPKGKWLGVKSPALLALVAVFLLANSCASVFVLKWVTADAIAKQSNYVTKAELLAFAWLNQNTKPHEVIAAPLPMSNLMGQFVDARTVAGHGALSPDAGRLSAQLDMFFRGEMSAKDAQSFLADHQIRFLFTEVGDGSMGPEYFETFPGVRVSNDDGGVTLYSVEPVLGNEITHPPHVTLARAGSRD